MTMKLRSQPKFERGPGSAAQAFRRGVAAAARYSQDVALSLRAALFLAAGVVALLAGGERLTAQEVRTGTRCVATNGMLVNFLALEQWEKRYPTTIARPPLTVPRPMPYEEPPGEGEGRVRPAAAAEPNGNPATDASADEINIRTAAVSPAPAASFLGLNDNNQATTPDTQGAVGPNHIMVVLNSQVRIMDRQGNPISTVTLATWWLNVQSAYTVATHPRVLYDPYADRWILASLGNENSSSASILLAVSQTSDPTGAWRVSTVNVDPNNYYYYYYYDFYGNNATADYISLGFNKQWIVVTANVLPLYYSYNYYSTYSGENIFVFDKQSMLTNGPANYTILELPNDNTTSSYTAFSMVPSVTYDESLAEMYLVDVAEMMGGTGYSSIGTRLRLSKLSGEVTHPILHLGVSYTASGANWANQEPYTYGTAPQLGSYERISLNDARIQNLVYRNGSLWCTHTVFLPSVSPRYSAVQWWQLSTNAAVMQFGRVEDPLGRQFFAYPSLAVNHCNDVLIGYSGFSSNQYASAFYSFRLGSDPANTLQDPRLFKAGEAPYARAGTNFFSGNSWGNYSATVVDPANDLDMWTLQEYAASPVAGADRWGTWWARVEVTGVTQCGQVQFAAKKSEVLEGAPAGVATIAVTNFTGMAGSVKFATSDGTAVAGLDYNARNGTLTFAPGQKTASFNIVIQDDGVVNSNRTVNLSLFNPVNLSLGSVTNSVLTIIDDEYVKPANIAGEFNFSTYVPTNYYWNSNSYFYSPYYVASEFESYEGGWGCDNGWSYSPDNDWEYRNARGALVTVTRSGECRGRVLVDCVTAIGGSAVPYRDYTPATNTLVFDDYQMSTNVLVPITGYNYSYYNNSGPRTIRMALSNPHPAPEEEQARPGALQPTLGPGSESSIIIMPVYFRAIDSITYTNGSYLVNYTNFGGFSFERSNYRVDEYYNPTDTNGIRRINVQVHKLGEAGTVRLHVAWGWGNYGGSWYGKQAGSDDAVSGDRVYRQPVFTDPTLGTIVNYSDFDSFSVDLSFGDLECRKNIPISIYTNPEVEFNEDIYCWLEQLVDQPRVNDYMRYATVTILYNDAPAGALDREWNPDRIAETTPPWNNTPGANNVVMALAVQPDGKTVLAGDFTGVNAVPNVRLARLNGDGSLDTGFNAGLGADQAVNALLLYPATSANFGRILVAGGFSSMNGQQRNGIARLLANGQLDNTFTPGRGANGTVHAIALQSNDKVVVAGDFTTFNDMPRRGIARLNADGSLDDGFNPGSGADGIVWSVGLTPPSLGPEKIVIGGDFSMVHGQSAIRVAQLNPDGSFDTTFNAGNVSAPVFAVTVQSNGRILVAGDFQIINNVSRIRIAGLLPSGALDMTFDPLYGANDSIYTTVLQQDGKILIGGIFTSYNNTRRMGLARLRPDGSLDTSFLDTAYNQFAGLVNAFSFSPPSYLKAIAPYSLTNIAVLTQTITNNGTNIDILVTNIHIDQYVMIGGSFAAVGGNPSYKAPHRNNYTVFTRADKRNRYNIARLLGGNTPGPGNAEFDADNYYVDENSGTAYIRMRRSDGRLGSLLGVAETETRTGLSGTDFLAATNANAWVEGYNGWIWSLGEVGSVYWPIKILDDTFQEGDELVTLKFLRAEGSLNLGGEYIPLGGAIGRAAATLTLLENDYPAGEFNFLYSNFITNENATYATITVIRTNGSVGPVTVEYFTRPSMSPMAAGAGDYEWAGGRLSFSSGQTTNSFTVKIINDTEVEYDETIELVLTNASGGAVLPGGKANSIATALVTIVDDDFPQGRLNFSSDVFSAGELDRFATITVTRTGGNSEWISVDYRTLDGTAISPADYAASTGTLQWDAGDSLPKTFKVQVRPDGLVRGPKTVRLELFNPRRGFNLEPALFGLRTNATLVIADADAYGTLAFTQGSYLADENGGSVTITVKRMDGSAGNVSVNYALRAATAIPNYDFAAASGVLTLAPGQISASFPVALLDDSVSDGNKTVWLELSNPNLATLGTPSRVLLTIVDNESYNEPAGSLDTYFNAEARANGPVNSLALQLDTNGVPDGRILLAGDFTEINHIQRNRLARLLTNGTLDVTFDVGQGPNNIVKSIAVQNDSRVLIGGFFTQVASTNRNGVARVYEDGTLDTTFNPGAGADNPVYSLYILPDGRILVAGAFSTFNSISRPGIVRLTTNGVVDMSFDAGAGPNGPVYAMVLQTDGKIVIGGSFTAVNGIPCGRVARLLANGTLDASFNPGTGMDADVWALVVQPDGGIIAGGDFAAVNGLAISRLARLKMTGEVDQDFLKDLEGANNVIFALKQQPDGKLVVAGDFTSFNGVTRNRITRLNSDGTTDYTINFGSGANGFIGALVIQPDRKIVLGGGFSSYDDQPRERIARIHGGTMSGNSLLEFSQPVFYAEETGTNALVVIKRRGNNAGTVSASVRTLDGSALAGRDYVATNGTVTFAAGEIIQNFLVPVISIGLPHEDRNLYVQLGDFVGGATNGPQPSASISIHNTKSLISFSSENLSVSENVGSSNAVIMVTRTMAINTTVAVQFSTLTNGLGAAAPGVDFMATNGVLTFLPGETNKSFRVRIIDDTIIEGNEAIKLSLTALDAQGYIGPFGLATLTIVDNDFGPGELAFGATTYYFREDAGFAEINILRTNGSSGVIALNYASTDGTARGGDDYAPLNGKLTFADGQTNLAIVIQILDDNSVEGNENFTVTISSPTGGSTISGSSITTITIEDNEFGPGSLYWQFDPGTGASDLVRALALQADGKMLVGGAFTNFNNTARRYLARLNSDGSLDTNFNAQPNALVTAITPTLGKKLVIGGNFSQVNGTNRNRIALLQEDGTVDRGFVASNALNAAIYTLGAQADGKLVMGGSFTLPMSGVARLLASGSLDVSFVPGSGADRAIYALELLGSGKIILGGEFTRMGSVARSRVACLNEDGLLDETFVPGAITGGAAVVYTLAEAPGGKIVVGGDFTAVGGVTRTRVARLNADGSLDTGFVATNIDGTVYALAVQSDGKVVLGGSFTNINGSARSRIARLNADGTVDPSFDTGRGADNTVYAVELLPDGKVLIGGSFTSINGFLRRGVALLRGDPTAPTVAPGGFKSGTFRLSVRCEAGMRYALEISPDLLNWTSLSTNTATNVTLELADPSGVVNQRFYRARLVP